MRPAATLLVGLSLLATTACAPEGLAFRADDRVTITSPEDRAEVDLPLTLNWEVKDFEVVDPGTDAREGSGYFAVFVDATPMPPGKDLRWLARNDTTCQQTAGCPDEEYLTSRGVYTTTDTRFRLERLPPSDDDSSRHRATIVLLDGAGKRIGESAFKVTFDVDQGDNS